MHSIVVKELRFLRVDSVNGSDLADTRADLSALGAHVIVLIFSCEKDPRKRGYGIKF